MPVKSYPLEEKVEAILIYIAARTDMEGLIVAAKHNIEIKVIPVTVEVGLPLRLPQISARPGMFACRAAFV